jgi:sugar transferase EpsL
MYLFCKRALDIAVAALGGLVAIPFAAVLMVTLRSSQGKILFRQLRPGLHGKPFVLYKFCTMIESRDAAGNLLSDAQRLTRAGSLVRSLSLDELPQLWNVLKGDMSLVGPRPLLMEYLSRYTPQQARRHDVRPGITGWAQVNGRNAISWEEKFRLDVWYVDNRSFALDLRILWLTFLRVATRSGISNPAHATMERFMGSDSDS